jgi:hypothetical protein
MIQSKAQLYFEKRKGTRYSKAYDKKIGVIKSYLK